MTIIIGIVGEINEQEFWRTLKSLNLLKSKNTDIVTTISQVHNPV